ncbi:MAG TPA: response regulator [Planctomycetaceae bacterium]|nr:response regulator [Planctomycetaceae bacterium]
MRQTRMGGVEAFPRNGEISIDWFTTDTAQHRIDAEACLVESAPTVFVVDGDEVTRGLVQQLAGKLGFLAKSCLGGRQLLESLDPDDVGCVVLEIRLPEMGGLLVQQRLRELGHSIPVVFLTAFGSIKLAVQAMQNGAVGFFEKPLREQELWDAILRGVEVHRQRRAVERRKRVVTDRLARLNVDERRVLELVLGGKCNRPIAEMLDLSVRTIELRRASVMRKLEVDTLPELFRFMCAIDDYGE